MDELRKAYDAEFNPEQAFRVSKVNPDGSTPEALRMYLADRSEIEKRAPSFYEGSHTTRFEAYIKFMLKRMQYDLDIPDWNS